MKHILRTLGGTAAIVVAVLLLMVIADLIRPYKPMVIDPEPYIIHYHHHVDSTQQGQ